MKVLIVEDEVYQAELIETLLENYDHQFDVIEILTSNEALIKYLNNHSMPDLIFMDIELEDGLCFKVFDQVGTSCPVIFTTSHIKYSLDAFYANGIHYLVKPITKGRLDEGLDKYFMLQKSLPNKTKSKSNRSEISSSETPPAEKNVILKIANKKTPFAISALSVFYLETGYVYLKNKEGKTYIVDHNLDELMNLLNVDHFFRLNRQTICHIDVINNYATYTRGRLKIDIAPYFDHSVVVSYNTIPAFLEWFEKNIIHS